jgi:CBS domain-containing protein
MKISNMVVSTGVARPGMTVRECFRYCVEADVPGIPFVDAHDRIVGRFSIRNTLKESCIPDYVVAHAELLGDHVGCLAIPEAHARKVLEAPADPFILDLDTVATIGPEAPVVKALAIMEKFNTSYIFVVEGERYLGTVTVVAIARRMLALGPEAS